MSGRLVLLAGTDPSEEKGGHRTYVAAHALAAAAAGFSPHVFYVAPSRGVEVTDLGVLHRVPSPVRPLSTIIATAHRPILAAAVARHLAGQPGPHLIHSFGAWAGTGVAASRILARRGVTAVPIANAYTTLDHESAAKVDGLATDHDAHAALGYRIVDSWVRVVASGSERRGYAGSQRILVNYESVRRLVHELCGPGVDIRRVPYAAPAAFRDPDAADRAPLPAPVARLRPAGAPLIVTVARHDPRKGIDTLLRALSHLAAAGIEFRACVVGAGPLLRAHRALAARLGLANGVAITGHVEDVFPYLQHADVFALPSLQEGSGSISLLEALQAGAAVIASRCDGIPEDVIDERDALLVAPGDSSALEAALARLLTDAPLRTRLQRRAHEVYEERFSATTFVSGLMAAYASLGFLPDH